MRIVRKILTAVALVFVVGVVADKLWSYEPIRPQPDQIGDLIKEMEGAEVTEVKPLSITECLDHCLFEELVANEMNRLEVFEPGFWQVHNSVGQFLEFVKIVESNGNPMARARTSTAMSLFQFTVPSVPTAVNRLENYMGRHFLGPLPVWAQELRESPTSLYYVPEIRQAILTLVNIAEQRGSDELLRQFFQGESEVAKEIYFLHHHTDPDTATYRRVEKIFNRFF